MADLSSTRVFGKLTVMHEAILKANAEITGDVTASSFAGDGSLLTNLNASNLASGTVPEARLPASALVGDTTYSAGSGITLNGTTFSLSNEAFTSAEKSKLAGIETGAEVNTVDSVNGATGAVVLDTGDISEGTNLYHTPARARSAISASGDLSYSSSTGVISFNETYSSAAEIKTAYESNTNTNAFTDALLSKLNGVEAGAEVNVGTNLGTSGTSTTRTVTSSTGSNVSLPSATTSTAGVMSASDKTKLNGIESGAEVNVATNLGQSRNATSYTVTSSTGTNTTLAAATTSAAGVMTSSDKSKLNGIESGATADQTKADIDALGIDADTLDGQHASAFVTTQDIEDNFTMQFALGG